MLEHIEVGKAGSNGLDPDSIPVSRDVKAGGTVCGWGVGIVSEGCTHGT